MPVDKLNIEEFIDSVQNKPILDVRSPGEYMHAHIPGAFSFPVFSNEERRIIGTAYKQQSREKAIKLGLDFFGKNMVGLVEEAEKIVAASKSGRREVWVHCWRGGMRSAAIAWLLDLYGFKVHLLAGGYKAYRHWVLDQLGKNYNLWMVNGYTGSDKTGIIQELAKHGESVIDLEGMAAHKGSAFGNLDLLPQPGQEHFENLLAEELYKKSLFGKTIWVEGESQRLGLINIPFSFYKNMRSQPAFFIDIPFGQRLEHIMKGYGGYEKEKLINAIVRLTKKLGGLETRTAIQALMEDDLRTCFSILLKYYDKLYLKSTYNKDVAAREVTQIPCNSTDKKLNTEKLLHYVKNRRD